MPTGVALITTSKCRSSTCSCDMRFAAHQPRQRPHPVRIAARERHFRPRIGQRAGRAARRAAVAHNQHRGFRQLISFESGPDTASASVFDPRHLPALRPTVFTAPIRRASGSTDPDTA